MLFKLIMVKTMSLKPEHKKQIIDTLKRELGTGKEVSKFSQSLKDLQLIDLSKDEQLESAVNDGSLMTYLTHYSLGLIPKLLELKYKET